MRYDIFCSRASVTSRLCFISLFSFVLLTWIGCRSKNKLSGANLSKVVVPSDESTGDFWKPKRVADVFFTTEVVGYIEPCGCTSDPLGGIQRLATVVSQSSYPKMLVDAGNLLLPLEGLDEFTKPQHIEKARLLARAYRKMGVAALNVAEGDLQEGSQLLHSIQKEGAVPWVSANIRPTGSGGPDIARLRLRTVGDIVFGVTGVAVPEIVGSVSSEVVVLELAAALETEVRGLKEAGAEVIIVLAHLPMLDVETLVKAIPDIDVIIRAPGSPIEQEPQMALQIGKTVIAEAGQQGQYVGRARFFLDEKVQGAIELDDAQEKLKLRKQNLSRKISAYKKQIEKWGSDASKKDAIVARSKMLEKFEAQLTRLMAQKHIMPTKPHVRIDILPIKNEVVPSEDMKLLLTAYYQNLRKMNHERGDTEACEMSDETKPKFVGSATCGSCHPEAFAFWRQTSHGHAWYTLEHQEKHYDLTCVGCHSVGFRSPGGFCRLKDVGELKDVGCENCHGAGSLHVQSLKPADIQRTVTEQTCTGTCHVPEHSDQFEYVSYFHKIIGPGHGLGKLQNQP